MAAKVLILQGSKSDDPYVSRIVDALQPYGLPIERRIASAHRTPAHLQRILDYAVESRDEIVVITVAGLSDALTGTVAARMVGPVIAAAPDFEKYGDRKVFSSTALPRGIDATYARTPEEAALLAQRISKAYPFSTLGMTRELACLTEKETIIHDARLQGVEEPPLPHTVFRRGKTRDVYDPGDGTLLIKATDRVSAFDVVMEEAIPGKGKALTELSEHWFTASRDVFPNHFIERAGEKVLRVKKADRVDVEWIVRSYLYGSLARDYASDPGEARRKYGIDLPDGLRLADKLPQPILTATTKADSGHDQAITREEAVRAGLVRDKSEWDMLAESTFRLYEFYRGYAKHRGIIIPDFKIEFGRRNGEYIQIDEPPTHDSARFWGERFYRPGEKQEGSALDKEFLRQFLIETGYKGDGPPPRLHPFVIEQVAKRVSGATEVLTGQRADLESLGLLSVQEAIEHIRGLEAGL